MSKIAFYVMTYKGLYVVEQFVQEFGPHHIEFIVSSEDPGLKEDNYFTIKSLAKKYDIKFFNRKDSKLEHIEQNFLGYKFAISWRWLIRDYKKLIVFHDSLLPRYRGFAPLVNSLINGEKEIGVTALFAVEEYDRGPIIDQEKIQITYPIRIYDAIAKTTPLYYSLVRKIYLGLQKNEKIKAKKQNDKDATYSVWLDSNDYFINWLWDAEKIERFIHAVGYPYDNAKAHYGGNIIKILDAQSIQDVKIVDRERHIGKIIFFKNDKPVVICGNGLLMLNEIEDIKGKKINIAKLRSRLS